MRAVRKAVTAGAQARLAQARLALKLAEERAGLRESGSREVQRAVSPVLSQPSGSSSGSFGSLAASWQTLPAWQDSGVLSLHGSSTLLLAALALRQGTAGWCGVVGGGDLGWCAAAEVGLDLSRVLVVTASVLDDSSTLTVASTLLDGVDVLLIDCLSVSRLSPRNRRLLLARARERGRLILTPAPWEGARTLRAHPLAPDCGDGSTAAAESCVDPSSMPSAAGVVVPIRADGGATGAPAGIAAAAEAETGGMVGATEMQAGYLRRLSWTLTDPRHPRRTGGLTLSLSASGLRTHSDGPVEPAAGPQEAAG